MDLFIVFIAGYFCRDFFIFLKNISNYSTEQDWDWITYDADDLP